MNWLKIFLIFFVILAATNIVYSRTSESVVCISVPCEDRSDFQKKIISEFDENGVIIRKTTIWCDGEVSVIEYDEQGHPLSIGQHIGNIPNFNEDSYNFNYTQVGVNVSSWSLSGYNNSSELLYNIQMINNSVQILYPLPPPITQVVKSYSETDKEDIDGRMLVIFPVPAKEIITLKIDPNKNKFDVSNCDVIIASIEGKIVFQNKNINLSDGKEYKIDISNLPTGDYGISVSITGAKLSISRSFLKN